MTVTAWHGTPTLLVSAKTKISIFPYENIPIHVVGELPQLLKT